MLIVVKGPKERREGCNMLSYSERIIKQVRFKVPVTDKETAKGNKNV